MKCPSCLSEDNKVIDTRKHDTTNCRVRECQACGTIWRTYEMNEKAIKVFNPTVKTAIPIE